jgi:hypothetical protein
MLKSGKNLGRLSVASTTDYPRQRLTTASLRAGDVIFGIRSDEEGTPLAAFGIVATL